MTPQDLKDIAILWFKAFNEQNLEDLLALYHHSAQHYSPKLKVREPQTDGLIEWKGSIESLVAGLLRKTADATLSGR